MTTAPKRRTAAPAPTVLYGIPNCDTVKKARAWLDDHGIAYTFHDYKKAGIDAAKLADWCRREGVARVLNKSGTTFRKLDEDQKANLDDAKARALMLAQPSLIRRPIVEAGDALLVGFDPAAWSACRALQPR